MKIGNREFDVNNHTYVMGILNVTPDSFSDGGKFNDMDRGMNVGASKRKLGSRVKLTAFSG